MRFMIFMVNAAAIYAIIYAGITHAQLRHLEKRVDALELRVTAIKKKLDEPTPEPLDLN